MSFDNELDAFREYVNRYHDNLILLADTYDVLSMGIPHAIQIFKEFKEAGKLPAKYGIRIDSGDLTYLSQEAARQFKEAGFPEAIISGSNDLDEYTIQSLKNQGCAVTSWGVGTKVITADGTSALGGVFKMAAKEEEGEFVPVMKISNDLEKMTNPGIKTVYRFYKKSNGKMITDLICCKDETPADGSEFTLVTETAKWRRKYLKAGTYTAEELLKPVMIGGERAELPDLKEVIAHANRQIQILWPEYTRFLHPDRMEINLSDKLQKLKSDIIDKELSEK